MTLYRIRYSIYIIEAADAATAKKKVCDMLKNSPEDLLRVEENSSGMPFWKRLLTGK
jgi:hypothetical protein